MFQSSKMFEKKSLFMCFRRLLISNDVKQHLHNPRPSVHHRMYHNVPYRTCHNGSYRTCHNGQHIPWKKCTRYPGLFFSPQQMQYSVPMCSDAKYVATQSDKHQPGGFPPWALDVDDKNTNSSLSLANRKTSAENPQTSQIQSESPYPEPVTGKLSMIQDGEAAEVDPTELYDFLRRMRDEDVLETFAASYQSMDNLHYAVCLKRLHTIHHRLHSDVRNTFCEELRKDQRFQVLCALITRKGPQYTASIAFDMFRFLRTFGFHDNHPACQVYIQLLKYHLNDLHLDQLMDLTYLLITTSQQNTNIDVILEGIKTLVPHRQSEYKLLTLPQYLVMLEQFRSQLTEDDILYVLEGIENDLDHGDLHLTLMDALSLLRGLSKIGSEQISEESILIEKCIAAIENKLQDCTISDLQDIVRSLTDLKMYCPDLLNDIGHMMTKETIDWPDKNHVTQKNQFEMLKLYSDQSHVHNDLWAEVSAQFDQCTVTDRDISDMLDLTAALYYNSFNHYDLTPGVSTSLCSVFDRVNTSADLDACLQFYVTTAVLGIHVALPGGVKDTPISMLPPSEFEEHRIFEPKWHGSYSVSMSEAIGLLRLHDSQSTGKQSTDKQIRTHTCKKSIQRQNAHFTDIPGFDFALKMAAPDHLIKTRCTLEYGLIADYVLENSSVKSNMSNDQDSKRLVVKLLPSNAFIRNSYRLKGFPRLYVTTLQGLGYRVWVVNPDTWKEIPEKEQAIYLGYKLQKTVEDVEESDSSILYL